MSRVESSCPEVLRKICLDSASKNFLSFRLFPFADDNRLNKSERDARNLNIRRHN